MKDLVAVLALLLGASAAQAQTLPDLKGTWIGKGKTVVFGTGAHHPGAPSDPDTPRVHDFEFTVVITHQEGSLAWGYTSSRVADTREPIALAVASDGKMVVGSDTNGSLHMTVVSADRMENCYTHTGLGPGKSIVANCAMFDRKK